MGLANISQLSALARIQVDIPSSLDNDWSTDVKKEKLLLPTRIKSELKKFLSDPIKRSKKTYKYRGKIETENKFWKVEENENTKIITYQIDPDNQALVTILNLLDGCGQKELVKYLSNLAENIPINHIYHSMSERPKDVVQDGVDSKKLEDALNKIMAMEK